MKGDPMRALLLVLVALASSLVALLADPATAGRSAASAKPTLTVRGSDFGRVLFDGSNRALYAFTRDPRGRSACYGACAAAWPPYIVTGPLRAGPGATRSLLGTTRRRDGKRQLTYAGKPLYYYVDDPVGEIRCQNVREFGGLWLVVRPSGALVR
jgi:predicted lipoprotein with Yx(FWY)xxD motif